MAFRLSFISRSSLAPILLAVACGVGGCVDPGATEAQTMMSVSETPDIASSSHLSQDSLGCTWSQWGQSAAHDGQSCVTGQAPSNILHHIVYDPF